MPRHRLNLTGGELDTLRVGEPEIASVADLLLKKRTSRIAEREDAGRRLNAVKASLRTVELEMYQ